MSRSTLSFLMLAAAFPLAAGVADARSRAKAPAATPPSTRTISEVGHDYEAARLLSGAERLTALEQAGQSVEEVLHGDVDADERGAARALAATIRDAVGDPRGASEAWERALESAGKGPFADDADFARIRAMEAAGRDAEAAREWARWSKRNPTSPLAGEALLAAAWNALRRGEPAEAETKLATLMTGRPWLEKDARVGLARATARWASGKPEAALALLGTKPQGPVATYVRAACLAANGDRLRSAALYQETAERWPDSPLADPARLAKANVFFAARDWRSAADEFDRVRARAKDPKVAAEAELRAGASIFLDGRLDSALVRLRETAQTYTGTSVAARAQFLVGEALAAQGKPAEAIVELNRVLTNYFQHSVAASAQYRVARCLDRLGRRGDATGAYQAVVSGYPLEPEAPAAAYLAGVGLMEQGKPLAAAPYFQLVLDRYAKSADKQGQVVFASPEHAELTEAALCLLELSYHRAGNLGQLSGAPHLMLQRMPPSRSPWRAYTMLIDADASAAQARYPEAQATLERLAREFPDHAAAPTATRLLAWTYARQNRDSLAIATEERLLTRYGATGSDEVVSAAFLDIAHERFNQKRYRDAAAAYEDFLKRYPSHPRRLTALYQAGLCYVRLDRSGDAVDRWEAIVRDSASAPIAERAWARAGDLYFQAERYDDARRAYQGLLEHFESSHAAALATLRLAQCDYNAGRDAAALEGFSKTIEKFPDSPIAREAKRGTELALYRLSQRKDGSQVLGRLVEQFPTSPFAADALFQIARRSYDAHEWTAAADGFRRVVSQFPGYSAADRAQFLLADAQAQAGQRAEAAAAYEQFQSYFPTSDLLPTVRFRLGLLHFAEKDYLQAAVAFTGALEDSVSTEVHSAARYNLALCQRLLGHPDEARTELERYRVEHPNDERADDVAYQLGDLADAAGEPDKALAEFDKALESNPKPSRASEIQFRIGRIHEQQGRPDQALTAFQRAATLGDRDDAFRLSAVARCATLYENRKEWSRALAAYRDIVRNAKDRELVAAAADRASQLEAGSRRR